MPEKIKHYIRFGSHNETKILTDKDVKSKIHHLAFNSNVVVHTPAAICKLLNFKINDNINYFIDPQTYILQLSVKKFLLRKDKKHNKYVLKSSIEKLLIEYGVDAKKFLENKYQEEIDDNIDILVQNVIDFQKEYLNNVNELLENNEGYSDFQDNDTRKIEPEFLIIPYFYLEVDQFEKWLELNIKAINLSREKFPREKKLACQLVLPKEIVFGENTWYRDSIITAYSQINIDTIFIWIDNLEETELSKKNIDDLIIFIRKISGNGEKKVINLYGGYFSYILSVMKIWDGFCHGPGYGESRSVIPVGGGIPTAKFYLPRFYTRINTEALIPQLLALKWMENYFSSVCSCSFCKKSFQNENVTTQRFMDIFGRYKKQLSSNNRQIPESDTLLSSQLHYLNLRIRLIENFSKDSINRIYLEIKKTLLEIEKCGSYIPDAEHLFVWERFIKSSLSGYPDE